MQAVLNHFNLRFRLSKKDEIRPYRDITLHRPMFDVEMAVSKGRSRPTWIFKSYWGLRERNPYMAIRNGLKDNEFIKWTPKYK